MPEALHTDSTTSSQMDPASPADTKATNQTATLAANQISNDCIGFRLRLLDRITTRIFNQELQPLGIRHTQLILLVALQKLGQTTPVRLGEWLSIEKSTLSRNLKLLRGLELIAGAVPENPQSSVIKITDKGAGLLGRALPMWENAQRKTSELFGADADLQIRKIVRHYWQLR